LQHSIQLQSLQVRYAFAVHVVFDGDAQSFIIVVLLTLAAILLDFVWRNPDKAAVAAAHSRKVSRSYNAADKNDQGQHAVVQVQPNKTVSTSSSGLLLSRLLNITRQ